MVHHFFLFTAGMTLARTLSETPGKYKSTYCWILQVSRTFASLYAIRLGNLGIAHPSGTSQCIDGHEGIQALGLYFACPRLTT